ncbi:hypothetical protein D3C81_1380180 [compost metagenome]
MALQRRDGEAVVEQAIMAATQVELTRRGIPSWVALPDQAKELLEAVVKIETFLGFACGQRGLFQLAQVLDAVALEVGLGINGRIAQLGPRLDIKHKQQAVHVAQAFTAELVSQVGVVTLEHFLLGNRAFVPDGLVGNQLDAFTQGVFEISGYLKGMLVRAVVQAVEQRHGAFHRQHRLAAQQRGHSAELLVITRAEQLRQVEA